MNTIELLAEIQKAAFEVRQHLHFGYVESVYQNALLIELRMRGFRAEKEVFIPVYYKGYMVGNFRADIFVENCVVIETKAVRDICPEHEVQLVNFLTATGVDDGVLVNYGESYRFRRKTRIYDPDSF